MDETFDLFVDADNDNFSFEYSAWNGRRAWLHLTVDIDGSQIVFSELAGGLVRVARLDLDRQLVCVSDPHNAGTVRFAYMRPYLQGSLEARSLPDGDNRWLLSSRHAQVRRPSNTRARGSSSCHTFSFCDYKDAHPSRTRRATLTHV